MGNHRGARRAAPHRRSERPSKPYAGRRVAGREDPVFETTAHSVPSVSSIAPDVCTDVRLDATTSMHPAVPGKRRATKSPRGRLRGVPPLPVVVGIAALSISAGGVLSFDDTTVTSTSAVRIAAPNAASGEIGIGVYDALDRSPVVSRDSDRDALEDASEASLVAEVEAQAEQRNEALGNLAEQAEKEAKSINLNRWSLPIVAGSYRLSADFGQAGPYWSSGYHTGLDFAAASGTPVMSVANGIVTSVGYEGAYGNQIIVTLEDGTEVWYNHLNSFSASAGDNVVAGQVIGTVGSTGNSTGPHLHLEVRPGGGDPTDPYAALVVNGVNP